MAGAQMIQNNASRLCREKSKRDYVTPLWKEFHWLPVKYHVYITSSQRSLWSQWRAFGVCACSLSQHCTASCSILVSYVRCSVLGDVLGFVSGSEIKFFPATFSDDFEVLLRFPRAVTLTCDCPAERVVRMLSPCVVPGLWQVFLLTF